jgi:pyruvate,water dikinase
MMMQRLFDWIKQRIPGLTPRSPALPFATLFSRFQEILALNNQVLETIAGANDKLSGDYIFDQHYIHVTCGQLEELVQKLINNLGVIAPGKYPALTRTFLDIQAEITAILAGKIRGPEAEFIIPYNQITRDLSEAVGGKNASLAELKTFLGIAIPDGFAISCGAFWAFMEHNGLEQPIKEITDAWLAGSLELEQASEQITRKIMAGRLPGRLAKELNQAVTALAGKNPQKNLFLAVRSSALGEDTKLTFAGQYLSLINEPVAQLGKAYIRVLASAYSSTAMEYRRRKGFKESEVAMAVACQEMIRPKASGVLYTLDPLHPEKATMVLSATWGLGGPVVSGRATADHYVINRTPPHRGLEVKLVRKESMLTRNPQGGTGLSHVREEQQTSPALTNEQIARLAAISLVIEKYFKKPQDIEFAVDQSGEIIILQARQLTVRPHKTPHAAGLANLAAKYPVIFRDQGVIAQRGVASGPVFLVKDDDDLKKFPNGAILVAKQASPLLAKVITKAAAIITDVGSATGHLATIAREFRVPALFDTAIGTRELGQGQEITVDAEENVIYRGAVEELCYYNLVEENIEETFEYRLLRRVLRKIEPLRLLDPSEKSFTAQNCRSLHDITRFIHEKAVETLIDLNYYQHHDPRTLAGKLKWDIPLDLIMIDIGGGLVKSPGKPAVILPEQIRSAPMQALLKGLEQPGAWDNEPMSVDFGSFMSSLTRTSPAELSNPREIGQNLAIVSREYANVSLRLGYHFTMIDSYISENLNDNYAYFRFFGGVTDLNRRSRRAKFLGEVLASHDFRVELHGDLVVARIKKLDERSMRQRLYLLGLLVGFTRQLDVKMVSEGQVDVYVKKLNTLLEETHEQY